MPVPRRFLVLTHGDRDSDRLLWGINIVNNLSEFPAVATVSAQLVLLPDPRQCPHTHYSLYYQLGLKIARDPD